MTSTCSTAQAHNATPTGSIPKAIMDTSVFRVRGGDPSTVLAIYKFLLQITIKCLFSYCIIYIIITAIILHLYAFSVALVISQLKNQLCAEYIHFRDFKCLFLCL